MTSTGDILFHKEFGFEDRSIGQKLFIILCSADSESPCLMLKTTSQSARYEGANPGCNPPLKVFYIPLERREWFERPTYVSLPLIYKIPMDEINKGIEGGIIEILGQLSGKCLSEIKNCLKRNFFRDLSVFETQRIF